MLLFTESLVAGRRKYFNSKAIPASVHGNALVRWNNIVKDFEVNSSVIDAMAEAETGMGAKTAVLGTDSDLTGTLVATVLAKHLKEKGFDTIRHTYTCRGYVGFGDFMTEEQLEACREKAARDYEFAVKTARETGEKLSYSKAVAVKTLADAVRSGEKTFRKPAGTNTHGYAAAYATATGTTGGYRRLVRLYYDGAIAYPRVDVNLIEDDRALQLYPHPPLDSLGWKDEYIQQSEPEQELPLNTDTALLYLNLQGLAPPSSYNSLLTVIGRYFLNEDGHLALNERGKNIANYLDRILTGEDIDNYRELLLAAHHGDDGYLSHVWMPQEEVDELIESDPTGKKLALSVTELLEDTKRSGTFFQQTDEKGRSNDEGDKADRIKEEDKGVFLIKKNDRVTQDDRAPQDRVTQNDSVQDDSTQDSAQDSAQDSVQQRFYIEEIEELEGLYEEADMEAARNIDFESILSL